MKQYLSESDSGDDDFFPSDHSTMPSTREPSPEPVGDTAKRYGLRLEDIFPRPIMFPILHQQIPSAYSSSRVPSPHMQRYSANPGLSPDCASQCEGRGGCFDHDVDSEVCRHNVDKKLLCQSDVSTVSQNAFDEMKQESMKLNRDTTWLRVVHCGYGQIAWQNELLTTKLRFVHGDIAAEGDYVLIPEGMSAETTVDMLKEVNAKVRKLVWFREMKRANKSRVSFKWEPFSVSPIGHELPTLVETKGKIGK